MPRPALRTRFLRRIRVKLPGGLRVIHYTKKKPAKAVCARCKKPLHGVARRNPSKLKKLAKTKRMPTRPYAGKLCSKCVRSEMKKRVR